MLDYSDSKIYSVKCLETGLEYIGSTARKDIRARKREHKNHYQRYKRGTYGYNTVFQIIEKNNYSMEVVEEFPCVTRTELEARESYWINNTDCVNKCKKRP
tara:strand:+ start:221 stop:523 length:303 start_codon:yes stop_codon:yes gene_type:complete